MGEVGRMWVSPGIQTQRQPGLGDDLTGLPTRQAFSVQLQGLCGQGVGSLLLCDLDYLKLINDTLGHQAGDAALRTVADLLHGHLRPGWQAYRLGGDEFAVLAHASAAELEGWGRAVMTALAQQPGPALRLSAGVAAIGPRRTPQRVLAVADRRLYAAKRGGRGRLVGDDEGAAPADPHQRLLERDEALGQLTTRLQAALNAPGGPQAGGAAVEVRAGPGGGLSAFLRVAERTARLLGYQTLRIQGDQGRRLRQDGAWATATLDGDPVNGFPETGLGLSGAAHHGTAAWRRPGLWFLADSPRPLALLLDRPEDFDAQTLEAVGALRAAACVCVVGRVAAPPGPLAVPETGGGDGAARQVIWLPPLSGGAVGMVGGLLCGAPLAPAVQTWLTHRSGGVPAEIGRWLGALLLEARLRHEDPVRLVETEVDEVQVRGDWQWSAARHLNRPPRWNRPYLWGRAALLQTAVGALRRGPVVVLTGPAGRGRTRLAEQLLMEYAHEMPGGAWAVSLAGIGSTEELLSRLSQTLLGQPADLGGLESAGRLLARRPTLLLLDDLPAGVGSAALDQLLNFAPETRVIVTASGALGLRGEHVLALPLLEPGVILEALHAGAPALPGPLTGRAAEWIRGDPARLQDMLRVLSIDPSGGLLGELLAAPPSGPGLPGGLPLGLAESRVLAALGLFSDVFSLSLAQAVTGASALTLAGLRDHGYLVSVGRGLYRLAGGLEGERLGPGACAPPAVRQARHRALAALGRVLEPPDPAGQQAWLARLDTVYVPLRSLLGGLLRRGSPEPMSGTQQTVPEPQLIRAVVALNPYRISRTYFLDARADLEQLLGACGAAAQTPQPAQSAQSPLPPPPPGPLAAQVAGLRLALAQVSQHLGASAQASALTAAVRADARLTARQHASALLIQGRVDHRRSDYSAAIENYRQAQHLLTRSRVARRAPELLAQALDGQARCLIYLDSLAQARRLNGRAQAVLGPTREPLTRARLLNTAALIDTEDRQLEAADACLRKTLDIHEAHGDREGQILNRMGLAWVRLLLGDGEHSVQLGRELLREAQDSARIWEIANILLNLGHAERLCGRVEEARAHYLEVAELVTGEEAPSLHAELLGGLAACARDQSCHDEARRLLTLALEHPGANAEVQRFFAPLQAELAVQRAGTG